jgi:multimeric flavodoxin WrbA
MTHLRRGLVLALTLSVVTLRLAAQDWPYRGGDPGEQRFSPLKQITPANVGLLRTAWTFDVGASNLQVTPLVVNGVMYLSGGSNIFALGPGTGKVLWKFETPAPVGRRGLAYWPGDGSSGPRILQGAGDRLLALDAKSGKLASEFGGFGWVDLNLGIKGDADGRITMQSPPAVYKNVIITGGNNGEQSPSSGLYGDIRGWDARTGKLLWTFHTVPREGEPGFEEDKVPSYPVKVENGRVLVNFDQGTKRNRLPHALHPLSRPVERVAGPVRVAGISTTAMAKTAPRYSGSEDLLSSAVEHAKSQGCETQLIRLNDLKFRACEGFYSKAARACTWPCSITQMDDKDELTAVYEALVHWADVVLIATPIRWGQASSLYFKMAERLNCVQNSITIRNQVLIRNKVAGFIIVGGQDNVQGVAGQMLGFFAELGFHFAQFPYIAHSRGWSAEDMENNVRQVRDSKDLHDGAAALALRSIELAERLIATAAPEKLERGGRKAHGFD